MSGSVRSDIRWMRLVSRDGDTNVPRDIAVEDTRPSDVIEIVDRPVYEVDPVSYAARKGPDGRKVLQRFRVKQAEPYAKKPIEVVVKLNW